VSLVPFREFINNNAFPFGALCVGVISVLITIFSPRPKSSRLRFWLIFGIPLSLAVAINFLPIWSRGTYPSCGRDIAFILFWAIPAGTASALILHHKERKFTASSNIDT
jgi:hypothetical protein